MSKLSGVVVILAGLGVAAYTLPLRFDTAGETAPPQPGEASKSILTGTTGVAIAEQPPTPPVPKPQPATRPEPSAFAQPSTRPFATTTERAAAPPVRVPQPSAIVGPPLDRAGLTRELQRELRRVGCYDGDISGVWTPAARRSMKAFTDRVNATLPIEQPDYILLAMVQSHQDKACGRACPAGQGLAEDGRCLPNAIVARASKKHVPAVSPPVANAALDKRPTAESSRSAPATAMPEPASERMALAGPNTEQAPTGALAAEKSPAAASTPSPDAAAAPTPVTQRPKPPKRSPHARARRPMGAWAFSDAPVDRVLGW